MGGAALFLGISSVENGKRKTILHEPSRSIAQWTMGPFSEDTYDADKGELEKFSIVFTVTQQKNKLKTVRWKKPRK